MNYKNTNKNTEKYGNKNKEQKKSIFNLILHEKFH